MKPIAILMIFISFLAGPSWASVDSLSPTPQAKTANSSASLFQSAVSAYERKNYPVALKILTELAEQGDAAAQFNLGVMYLNGEGVPRDVSQALTWYHKAAEQGNAVAQFFLGDMYRYGEGVPKDYVQAAKWLYLAKANGAAKTDEAIRQIESMMSHQQIEQAQALATQWWQNHH
mgnify:CR=1 FL=1